MFDTYSTAYIGEPNFAVCFHVHGLPAADCGHTESTRSGDWWFRVYCKSTISMRNRHGSRYCPLLETVRVAPCSRAGPSIRPIQVETNRGGLCETCFDSDLRLELAHRRRSRASAHRRTRQQMKANGMKYRVSAWIHPDDGDDYEIDWYVSSKPTTAEIRRRLSHEGSAVLNDWQLIRALAKP